MRKRRRETWTFQPDAEITEAVEKVFGKKLPAGLRTKIVNEALRLRLGPAVIMTAQREVSEAINRLEFIRQMIAEHCSPESPAANRGAVHLNDAAELKNRADNDPQVAAGINKAIAEITGGETPKSETSGDDARRRIAGQVKRSAADKSGRHSGK